MSTPLSVTRLFFLFAVVGDLPIALLLIFPTQIMPQSSAFPQEALQGNYQMMHYSLLDWLCNVDWKYQSLYVIISRKAGCLIKIITKHSCCRCQITDGIIPIIPLKKVLVHSSIYRDTRSSLIQITMMQEISYIVPVAEDNTKIFKNTTQKNSCVGFKMTMIKRMQFYDGGFDFDSFWWTMRWTRRWINTLVTL